MIGTYRFIQSPEKTHSDCRRKLLPLIVALVAYGIYMPCNALAGQVDVGQLKAIVTGPAPSDLEQKAAYELSRYLKRIYGISLPVASRTSITKTASNVILLGEKAVLAAGAIKQEELDKVKWDGYVIKVQDNRIAMSDHYLRCLYDLR